MKEHKRYQIEKVYHSAFSTLHTCCLIDYYPMSDCIGQFNFTNVFFAEENKIDKTVGMWRIKQQKLKQSKN